MQIRIVAFCFPEGKKEGKNPIDPPNNGPALRALSTVPANKAGPHTAQRAMIGGIGCCFGVAVLIA